MDWNVWGPPLVVLVIAGGLGIGVAIAATRRTSSSSAGNRLEELDARKATLVEALRELDADRGKLDEPTWSRRREGLLEAAAETLRAREAPAPAEPQSAPPPRAVSNSGLVWAGSTALFFAGLALLLVQSAKPRAQGGSMTGGMEQGTDAPDPEELAARETLKKDPNDLAALNTMTWLAIRAQDLNGAMAYLDSARKVDPHDPLVLTHLAVLSLRVGMADRADVALSEALTARPGLARALLFRGLARLQLGDKTGAEAALTEVLGSKEASAEERQMASSILTEVRRPPVQERVGGTVALAPGLSPPTGSTLFVIARRTATPGGPPVAAVRQPGPTFPFAFTVTDENMMLGGAWPGEVWVQARLDSDGNPTTKADTDIESPVVGPLPSGATEIVLVLGGESGSP